MLYSHLIDYRILSNPKGCMLMTRTYKTSVANIWIDRICWCRVYKYMGPWIIGCQTKFQNIEWNIWVMIFIRWRRKSSGDRILVGSPWMHGDITRCSDLLMEYESSDDKRVLPRCPSTVCAQIQKKLWRNNLTKELKLWRLRWSAGYRQYIAVAYAIHLPWHQQLKHQPPHRINLGYSLLFITANSSTI